MLAITAMISSNRAPTLEAQYERQFAPYLAVLGLYDAGQVAVARGDLSLANMRHSFGFGISLWAESKVVFRANVGLGSGEGVHKFFVVPGGLP